MSEIKVSVIVPVYNVEKYLEECVESLVNQTLKDIEILLIDDGSTDSSGDICDRYAEKYANIHVIHKLNGGLGDARNVGFAEANGKYVYFIDSDDYLELEALEFLYEEAERKQLDVILFSAESFSDESDIEFDPEEYKRTKFLNEIKTGEELFVNLYSAKEYYASIPLRFYNKDYFNKDDYKFPDVIHEDEFPGFLSLVEANRAECVENKFYKRRFRKGSIMTSEKAYKSAMGYVYTWKELMKYYKTSNLEYRDVYWEFSMKFLKLVSNMYCQSFEKIEKEVFKSEINEMKVILKNDFVKLDKSIKLFISSPFLFVQYKKLVKKRGF